MMRYTIGTLLLLAIAPVLSSCNSPPKSASSTDIVQGPANNGNPSVIISPPVGNGGELIHPGAAAPVIPTTEQVLAPPAGFDPAETLPYLASDQLEGRGIGMHGLDEAADFIAGHFASAGLTPLPGENGFFQTFDYTAAHVPSPDCSLTVAGKTLKIDQDYRPLSFSGEGSFNGEMVFAGYGITDKKRNYDDYAGLNAKGKIVLAMRFEPMDAKGKSLFATGSDDWSDDAHLANKVQTAIDHGAAAILLFTPKGMEPADPLVPFSHNFHGMPDTIAAVDVKEPVAAMMVGDLATITYDATGKPSAPAAKAVTVSGKVAIQRTIAHLKNVIGCVRGVGPHADEYVVVGAHYDHLGKGQLGFNFGPVGSIYHGADDNASGTSAVMELAAQATAAPPRQRTIVFMLFSGEEEGLIGSAYFTAHPLIPLDHIAAMLNLDMVGRVVDNTIYVGGQGTAKDFDSFIQSAGVGQPLVVKPMPSKVGGRGGLGPSDHMSFALKKIPVLFLFSGLHADYHRPTDVASKINYPGIQEVVGICAKLIDELAAMPRETYDTIADDAHMSISALSSGDHPGGAVLGVIPDYATELTQAGVLIQGVHPHWPAEMAGLQGGDIILQFGDKKLEGLQDLFDCLAKSKPGQKVALIVQRNKQTLTFDVTLIAPTQ